MSIDDMIDAGAALNDVFVVLDHLHHKILELEQRIESLEKRVEMESKSLTFYNVNQLAEKLGVTRSTVYSWISSGKLKEKRNLAGRLYFTDEDIKQFYNVKDA